MRNDWDDDRLLGALSQALKARQAVPSWFIETGKHAFAWHNIDAELAQLTYDSNEDRREAAAMRSETASIRALTFTSAHLSVELEVTGNSLLGQLLPAREGELEIHTRAGEISTTDVDEIGCFSVDPIPDSPFRLRCRTADGTDVLTGWITILGSASGGGKPGPGRPAGRVLLAAAGPDSNCATEFSAVCVSNRGREPSVMTTEPARAGGTRGLGRGDSGLSAPTGASSGPYR